MPRIALESLGGNHLNVETSGNGPPILAIHGFTGNLRTWDAFSTAMQKRYSVVRIDVLGHGQSDSPEVVEFYTMERTISALAELLDKLSLPKVHWLGYSMGGRIALAAAVSLKERALSLVLESGSPGLASSLERAARVKSDESLAGKIKASGIESFINYWESLPMWASQARLPAETRTKLRAQRLTNNPVGLSNSLIGIGTGAQPSFHERLAEILVPTLFIAGEEDKKFAQTAQEMCRSVKTSQCRIVKESGHTVHLEQPGQFNAAVLAFLKTIESRDAKEAGIRSRPSL